VRTANVPELQQHEIQLPYNEPSLVGNLIEFPMPLALQATEADLDTFSSHPCLNIVLECFIHHLRYVFAIFAFRSQPDQQHPDMKT